MNTREHNRKHTQPMKNHEQQHLNWANVGNTYFAMRRGIGGRGSAARRRGRARGKMRGGKSSRGQEILNIHLVKILFFLLVVVLSWIHSFVTIPAKAAMHRCRRQLVATSSALFLGTSTAWHRVRITAGTTNKCGRTMIQSICTREKSGKIPYPP